jgi:hypothetical protein
MSSNHTSRDDLGILLPNGCRLVHGQGTNTKSPFSNIPVVMNELDRGGSKSYRGQFGFILFDETVRLPRHIHIETCHHKPGQKPILVTERIMVLDGVAMVELNGSVYVIPPGSAVIISPGVPHTWTACPPGVKLPDGSSSEGKFCMVYEYEEQTGFFPTKRIDSIESVDEYEEYDGDLEEIRFPLMRKQDVVERAKLVWNLETIALQL